MRKNHIFSQELIFQMAHELKKQGKVIGFTHGAYDLFHYGHLDQLSKSADECDFLIVGIDSDESVRSYKGDYRPIIPEEQRVEIISSLSVVDAVFIKDEHWFSDEMLIQLYKEIQPNFVSIGREFAAEEKIRVCAEKAGSKVLKFDTVQPSTNTTNIINEIIERHRLAWEKENRSKDDKAYHRRDLV